MSLPDRNTGVTVITAVIWSDAATTPGIRAAIVLQKMEGAVIIKILIVQLAIAKIRKGVATNERN